jgi:hypothetical protein
MWQVAPTNGSIAEGDVLPTGMVWAEGSDECEGISTLLALPRDLALVYCGAHQIRDT